MASGLRYAGEMSGLTFLDETTLRQYGPEQLLNRMLSTKSYISTAAHGFPSLESSRRQGRVNVALYGL